MAYRIQGVIRLDDSGNANLGIASATEFDGKVSEKAISEQTDGGVGDVTGADELLLYDTDTGNLLRVTVDEFVRGAGIGTIVTDFDNLNVTGIATIGNYADISQINSDTFVLLNSAGTQPRVQATSGGDAILFSGGLAKLQTQSWGTQINGRALITQGANIGGILTTGNIQYFSDMDISVGSGDTISLKAKTYLGQDANLDAGASVHAINTFYPESGIVLGEADGFNPDNLNFRAVQGNTVGEIQLNEGLQEFRITSKPDFNFADTLVSIDGDTETITVGCSIIPDTNVTYDLGSPTNRFRDIYLEGNTIFLGDTEISADTVVTSTDGIIEAAGFAATTGIVTAASFHGDGSAIDGISASGLKFGLEYDYGTSTDYTNTPSGFFRVTANDREFGIHSTDRNDISQAAFFANFRFGWRYTVYVEYDGGACYLTGQYFGSSGNVYQFRNGTRRGNLPGDGTDCKLMIMGNSSISVRTIDSEVTGIASVSTLSGFGATAISVSSNVVISGITTINDHLRVDDSNNAGTEYNFSVRSSGTPYFGVLGNGAVLLGPNTGAPFIASNDHHATSKKYVDDAISASFTSVGSSIIPDTNIAYDLGSDSNRFRDLYLEGTTIYLGEKRISTQNGKIAVDGQQVIAGAGLSVLSGVLTASGSGILTYFGDGSNVTGTGGGGILNSVWKWSSDTGTSNPGDGKAKLNNGTYANATEFRISKENEEGYDVGNAFGMVTEGARVYLQEREKGNKYAVFNVTGTPTESSAYWTIPVLLDRMGSKLSDGKKSFVAIEVIPKKAEGLSGSPSINVSSVAAASTIGVAATSYLADVNISGDITTTDANIVFADNAGTYPTSGKGFKWDLNSDEAFIYAIQSANDYIDLVFKVIDNTNNQNDRWVFWLDSYEGQSQDSFPLTMTADYAYFFCTPSTTDGKPNVSTSQVTIDSAGNLTADAFIQDNGPKWTSGSGSPEGSVTAPVGSLYTRTDGGSGSTLYVKESGTGNTGWSAK